MLPQGCLGVLYVGKCNISCFIHEVDIQLSGFILIDGIEVLKPGGAKSNFGREYGVSPIHEMERRVSCGSARISP